MRSLVVALLCAASVAILHAQTIYDTQENISLFGWLDQYSLDNAQYNFVGDEACVPTSSTNAMTYLQNLDPGLFGTSLTGTTYSDWISTDATLISSPYMDTKPSSGTYFYRIPYALTKYVTADRGFGLQMSGMFDPGSWNPPDYPQPSFVTNAVPTGDYLYQSLASQSAVLLSIYYTNGAGGHELLGSGLQWTDLNNDGIIEFNENATLSFVDPLDPSATYPGNEPGGAAKFTTGHIWYDSTAGNLRLSYDQYQGALPYSSSDYQVVTADIINALSVAPVPESAAWAYLPVLLLLAGVLRRRTSDLEFAKVRARFTWKA